MTKTETTRNLSLALEKYIDPHEDPRIYWAKEVSFDCATDHKIRVDYMQFKPVNNSVSGIEKGDFYCYEIKSSVEDFQSKHGHNFIGDFNYYVMLENVYEKVKDDIPYGIGVLVPDGEDPFGDWLRLKCIKKPRRQNRSRSVSEMLLMMFRSAKREYRKAIAKKDSKQIPRLALDTGDKTHPYMCPSCRHTLEIGYKHCIFCGQKLRYEEAIL